jgi:hypothetical protein
VPAVDFEKNLVVFSRNTQFYNRTRIGKTELNDGVLEIVAMETLTSRPIEDKVAMAMAVVPREGIRSVKASDELIPVEP